MTSDIIIYGIVNWAKLIVVKKSILTRT